jgi:hypothetical protein
LDNYRTIDYRRSLVNCLLRMVDRFARIVAALLRGLRSQQICLPARFNKKS